MTRNLRILFLVVVVALTASAVLASAATAKNWHSTSGSGTTHITGTQIGTTNWDFANGTTFKCSTTVIDATFSGTTAGELTATGTISGCTAAGQAATFDMNGCTYTITTPTEIAPLNGDNYDAVVHLVCPAGAKMKITVPTAGCTVEIAPQTPTNPVVDLTNNTGAVPKDVVLKWTLEGIHYTTIGGGICGAAGQMKLTGEYTLRAYSNATHTAQVDLFIA